VGNWSNARKDLAGENQTETRDFSKANPEKCNPVKYGNKDTTIWS
jgi:hypothetical protein